MELADLGAAVRRARKASGLSQKDLARMAGLSRATLNYLENEPDTDMGAAKLLAILDILGIGLTVTEPDSDDEVVRAALVAAAPSKRRLAMDVLIEAVVTGRPPIEHGDALRLALTQMPTAAVVATVRLASAGGGVPPKAAWKHVRALAQAVQAEGWLTES